MRPLHLKLCGLRSYRELQEVSFEDASLVAILGDTGAGKSSLLEAITVALYGTSTWDARETKPLISDGATTMQVSLTFRAEGKTWRVERAISRGSYPPARHTLELLDGGERLDKKDAVDARIRQLVGLDYDAFLRSVVLPQGRFAALLQAKPAERAQILKGILRIDRLDGAREGAREARDRMLPVVDGLRERRSKLHPDPPALEREAEERQRAAAASREAAEKAREAVSNAREKGRSATTRAVQWEALIRRAAEGRVTGAAEALRILIEHDTGIELSQKRNGEELLRKKAHEEELASEIDAAEKRGAGPESLATAKSSLSLLVEELPMVTADARALEKERELYARETADLEKAKAMLATFVTAETEAKQALAERRSEEKRAAEKQKAVEKLCREHESAKNEEAKASQKAEKVRADLTKATGALESSAADVKKAQAKNDDADAAARAAAQKHAAHHASAGLRSGQECPVCTRALPDGWKAPEAPLLEAVQKKLEKAKSDLEKAREKATTAQSKAESLREKLAEAEAEVGERRALVSNAEKGLLALLAGALAPGDTKLALSAVVAEYDLSARSLAEAESRALSARDVVTRATAELSGAQKRATERAAAHKKATEAWAVRKGRLDKAVAKLPLDLRPSGWSDDLNTNCQLEPQVAEIASLLARVEVRREKIEEVARALSGAKAARQALEMERERLSAQRVREVTQKVGALDVAMATFRDRLCALAEALSQEPPPARPEGAELTELCDFAVRFEAEAEALLSAAMTAVKDQQRIAEESEEVVRLSLARAGVDSEAALDKALSLAEGLMAAAEADLARARAEKPLAAALDAKIERASGLLAALGEVTRLLADGKLIHHVVHRRQRVLLAVASELLGSMTRGRYGFSEDFEVVDRVSGQARGTRTLSGGETFLASLALSLALVELAGRAGGRLDALFLDEGFGSLDASSLSEALSALTSKAEGGRLVAVISHLRSVAESIDKVLAVRMSPSGSRVSWVSAEEREKMLAMDVERGLVS